MQRSHAKASNKPLTFRVRFHEETADLFKHCLRSTARRHDCSMESLVREMLLEGLRRRNENGLSMPGGL
jgi:plasmid stability protein